MVAAVVSRLVGVCPTAWLVVDGTIVVVVAVRAVLFIFKLPKISNTV